MLSPIKIPGLFITGTDTDVGKTVIAGAIANYFLRDQQKGREPLISRVAVSKPVATGCVRRREGLVSEDAEFLASCADARFPLDVIHRRMLERILPRFGLEKVEPKALDELNLAWHRLDAWKDVAPGFARLRKRFLIAPCSNGNIALMVDIARRNDIRWDAILGSEVAGDFKPKPRVYLSAAAAFNIEPCECMMVAAHSNDLAAAASSGLRTGHVARPDEKGKGTGEEAPNVPVDIAARNFVDLADQLGA